MVVVVALAVVVVVTNGWNWDNEEGAGVVESESSLGRDRRTDDLLDRG